MAEIHHTHDTDTTGSGAALGIILGVLLVLALLVGGWWLFFRPIAVEAPVTPMMEQPEQSPAPQGDMNNDIDQQQVPGGGVTTETPQ